MHQITIPFLLFLCLTKLSLCTRITFVTWNVNDNRKFAEYSSEIVSSLLQLKSVYSKDLPDIYAITLQENCLNCKDSHLDRLATPFIDTLQSLKSVKYKLVSIQSTRKSMLCELIYCMSMGSMHGATLMMILAKEKVAISGVFENKVVDCTSKLLGNKEKGVVIVGFTIDNKKYCFGGLHLDVSDASSRQKCITSSIENVKGRCDVTFFGGDFNTRPKSKDTPKPKFYEGGIDLKLFSEMKVTDDLSGSKPYSGGSNLLKTLHQNTGLEFIEPFNKSPNFIPTYSIDSSKRCKYSPVCYKSSKYPAWTDRIIYTKNSQINCKQYSAIETLAQFSDHLPVLADCEMK